MRTVLSIGILLSALVCAPQSQSQAVAAFFSELERREIVARLGQHWIFREEIDEEVHWDEVMQFAVQYRPPRQHAFCFMKFVERSRSGQAHLGWAWDNGSTIVSQNPRGSTTTLREAFVAVDLEGEGRAFDRKRGWIHGTLLVVYFLDPGMQQRQARSGLPVETNIASIRDYSREMGDRYFRPYGGRNWKVSGTRAGGPAQPDRVARLSRGLEIVDTQSFMKPVFSSETWRTRD